MLKSFLILSIAILGFSFVDVEAQSFSNDGAITQKQIEKQVNKRILRMVNYGVFDHIKFEVNGSTVTLSGKVNNALNYKTAEKTVERIDGVNEVINNIEILPPSSFDDRIRRRTVRTFLNTGGVYRLIQGVNPPVKIIVDNGHLTLEGQVRTEGDYRFINIAARSVPGVFSVTNNLEVTKVKKY